MTYKKPYETNKLNVNFTAENIYLYTLNLMEVKFHKKGARDDGVADSKEFFITEKK